LLLAERKNAYRVKGGVASLITLGWVGGELLKLVSYKRNKNRLGLTQAIAC